MSLTNEHEQVERTEVESIDERKEYGPPQVQRIATQSTEGGGRPAYIEDGFGVYQS